MSKLYFICLITLSFFTTYSMEKDLEFEWPHFPYVDNESQDTLLHSIARSLKRETYKTDIEKFIQMGCDPNLQNNFGQTACNVANAWSNPAFIKDILILYNINKTLPFKLDLNIKDKLNNTIFQDVLTKLYQESIKTNTNLEKHKIYSDVLVMLLNVHNTDIDRNYFPLHDFCNCDALNLEKKIIFALDMVSTEYLKIQDTYGDTLLHKAARFGLKEVTQYLLEKNYSVINIQNKIGRTALHEAVLNNRNIVTKIILDNGNCLLLKDIFKQTPLDYCKKLNKCWNNLYYYIINSKEIGYIELMKRVKNNEIGQVKHILSNNNPNVMFANEYGLTALHVAVINDSEQILKMLLNSLKNQSKNPNHDLINLKDEFENSLFEFSHICNSTISAKTLTDFMQKNYDQDLKKLDED